MKLKLTKKQKERMISAYKKALKNITIQLKPEQIGVGDKYPLSREQLKLLVDAKKKQKSVRLKLSTEKNGGFIPLLLAGAGALAGLISAGASVANTIIDKNDKEKIRQENERHNREIEKLIKLNEGKNFYVGSNLKKKKEKLSTR